jgi:Zn-dependent M28 family amino/carboxypeptidase
MAGPPIDTSELREAVTAEGVFEHLGHFQAIADANGGTRAAGTSGYDESADHVADLLSAAGYVVTRQQFEFAFYQELAPSQMDRVSPDPRVYVDGVDFDTMQYSGSGEPTATVQPTNDVIIPPAPDPNTSNSGCEVEDFDGFVPGNIALIQRGTCTFETKALNAQDVGASGVIIFNEGQEGRTDVIFGTLGNPSFSIPVFGASFEVGEELYNLDLTDDVVVHMFASTESENRPTENVLAETASGREDRTVIAGGHLDSVLEGPGITDNASGSATLLEIALQMAELGIVPRNKVVFAFWGAEESGLIGSTHYVSLLSKNEIKDISAYLNFDMVSSTNYVRFVFDGDGSDLEPAGPNGSKAIEALFLRYFSGQGLATDPTALAGNSDYGPFMDVGVPVGGLFSGASSIKTEEQAEIYGGVAGIAYHECFHLACDDITQANPEVVDQLSDGAAHAILTLAMTKASINGSDKGKAMGFSEAAEFLGSLARK